LLVPFLPFGNWFQHGSRKYFQCIEVVHAIRLLIEKSLEWGTPLVLVSIDLLKAFDSLRLSYVCYILGKYRVPLRLRYAILRELCALRKVSLILHGIVMGYLWSNRGLCQGSPEASFIFSLVVGDMLATLDRSWKARGLGVLFGKFGGSPMAFSSWWDQHFCLLQGQGVDIENFWVTSLAFLDDIYFASETCEAAQTMLEELLESFAKAGLSPNIGKVAWMANKYVSKAMDVTLRIGHILIPVSPNLVILGSFVSMDGHEEGAFRHRATRAWACFHKWEHVLCSRAALSLRLRFWEKVVQPSLLWGLQTLRSQNIKGLSVLRFCQGQQIRKMMRLKRKPIGNGVEPWVDWQIRTLHQAKEVAERHGCEISRLFFEHRFSWAGHVARLGVKDKQAHIVHFLLLWRPLFWWREQQLYAHVDLSQPVVHPSDWGRPRRFENGLEPSWMMQALSKYDAN
jgi:hypothetical protein